MRLNDECEAYYVHGSLWRILQPAIFPFSMQGFWIREDFAPFIFSVKGSLWILGASVAWSYEVSPVWA